jgi:hypothetical protein
MASGVHIRRAVRAFIAIAAYAGLVSVVSLTLIASPASALVSPQAYARVVQQAEWIAYQAARKPAIVQAVAQAVIAPSPASLAFRAVTGPVGWAALGVGVALTLVQTYYSANDLMTIKQAVAASAGLIYTYNGQVFPISGYSSSANATQCPGGKAYFYTGSGFSSPRPGFFSAGSADWWCPPTAPLPDEPTQQSVENYLNTLPQADPNSIESHTQPKGVDQPTTPAQTDVSVPVSPTELPTTVKKTETVLPTDVVVNKDVPPPAGATTTQTTQQTATTQTTTNPDGSQTEDQTATTSCAAGSHDQRSFGSVLIEHQTKWNNAPLLSALTQLKTLTWPSTLPVVAFSSVLFGSFQIDFNAWAWVFLALKTLILAGASFAAYRIVFVGGR